MEAGLRRLRNLVQQSRADVIIGKRGVDDGVLREIERRLLDKGVVKVKALKTAVKSTGLDRRSLARLVASRLNAVLLDVRGRTFVLYLPPEERERRLGKSANKPSPKPRHWGRSKHGYSLRGAGRAAHREAR